MVLNGDELQIENLIGKVHPNNFVLIPGILEWMIVTSRIDFLVSLSGADRIIWRLTDKLLRK